MEVEFNGISPALLIEHLNSNQNAIALVDCRSSIEFETSHINGAVSLGGSRASRREIMGQRVCVVTQLKNIFKEKYNHELSENYFIVVYDQSTLGCGALHAQSLLYRILDNLRPHFLNTFLLEGGFIGFQSQFPDHCWISERKQPDEDFVAPMLNSSPGGGFGNDNSGLSKLTTLCPLPSPLTEKMSYERRSSGLVRSATTILPLSSTEDSRLPLPIFSYGSGSGSNTNRGRRNIGQIPASTGPALAWTQHSLGRNTNQPTSVLPHLLLGSQQDAMSATTLRIYRITHIINVSTDGIQSPYVPPTNFLRIPVLDNFSDRITDFFPVAFQFLEKVRHSGGKALVHCSAGISRSPTLAIAYLMRFQGLSVSQAYDIVKASRPSVSPNFNFMGQLTHYELELQQQKEQQQQQPRPKRKRPTRLGFLSSLLRVQKHNQQNNSEVAISTAVVPVTTPDSITTASSSGNSSSSGSSSCFWTPGVSSVTGLLPSPSVPFSMMGLNSPIPTDAGSSSNHRSSLLQKWPGARTSLAHLTFRPCQPTSSSGTLSTMAPGFSRAVKVKRVSSVSSTDNVSSSNIHVTVGINCQKLTPRESSGDDSGIIMATDSTISSSGYNCDGGGTSSYCGDSDGGGCCDSSGNSLAATDDVSSPDTCAKRHLSITQQRLRTATLLTEKVFTTTTTNKYFDEQGNIASQSSGCLPRSASYEGVSPPPVSSVSQEQQHQQYFNHHIQQISSTTQKTIATAVAAAGGKSYKIGSTPPGRSSSYERVDKQQQQQLLTDSCRAQESHQSTSSLSSANSHSSSLLV